MNNTALLDIGAEADCGLVEIAPEDRASRDRGSVAYGDLEGENHVGSHVSIHGDFRKPQAQRDYLPLTSSPISHDLGKARLPLMPRLR